MNFSSYMRVHPDSGHIEVRTTVHPSTKTWPTMGFSFTGGGGATSEEIIEFGEALIAFAKKNPSKPKNWPPKQDDVWRIGSVVYHAFLGSGENILMWRAGGGSPSKDSTSSFAGTLLKSADNKAELLFRL